MNYNNKFFWQHRELQRALAALRPSLSLPVMLPPTFMSQMRNLEILAERFTLPTQYLIISQEIQKAIGSSQINHAFREIASHNHSMTSAFTELQKSIACMAAEVSLPSADVSLAIQAMKESLVPTEALLRLGKLTPTLMDISLRPQIAFQEFTSALVAAADATSEIFRANTLSTIEAASGLLTQMSRGPELASLLIPPSPDILPLPEVNVFSSLEDQLAIIDLDLEDIDPEEGDED